MNKLKASLLALPFVVSIPEVKTQNHTSVFAAIANSQPISSEHSVLPITWGEIKVSKKNESALLQWTSLDEFNADIFIIEHSTDGKIWTIAGKRLAAGNSRTEKYYQFVHDQPVAGNNYYRLQQIDKDGERQYSKVLRFRWQATAKIGIYPNPARGGKILVTVPMPCTLQIFNNVGILVKQESLSAGANAVDISMLKKGLHRMKAGEEATSVLID